MDQSKNGSLGGKMQETWTEFLSFLSTDVSVSFFHSQDIGYNVNLLPLEFD